MRLSETAVLSASSSDKAAMQVIHYAQTILHRQVRSVSTPAEQLGSGAIAFVTVPHSLLQFPSKFFRFLPAQAAPGTRLYREREKVMASFPWLLPAGDIVCINPVRLHADEGIFKNGTGYALHLDGMIRALRDACEAPRPKPDPYPHLSPEQKRMTRLAERRISRHSFRSLGV